MKCWEKPKIIQSLWNEEAKNMKITPGIVKSKIMEKAEFPWKYFWLKCQEESWTAHGLTG